MTELSKEVTSGVNVESAVPVGDTGESLVLTSPLLLVGLDNTAPEGSPGSVNVSAAKEPVLPRVADDEVASTEEASIATAVCNVVPKDGSVDALASFSSWPCFEDDLSLFM